MASVKPNPPHSYSSVTMATDTWGEEIHWMLTYLDFQEVLDKVLYQILLQKLLSNSIG